MAAPDSKITSIPSECPRCAGQVYDNTKGKGKTNPKSPDARCKDRDGCGWAGWLPEAAKTAARTSNGPPMPHAQLQKLCVQYQLKEIKPLLEKAGMTVTTDNILAGAATLMINATNKGGELFPPKAAPEPSQAPAPRPAPPPRRSEYDDTSDDLPF